MTFSLSCCPLVAQGASHIIQELGKIPGSWVKLPLQQWLFNSFSSIREDLVQRGWNYPDAAAFLRTWKKKDQKCGEWRWPLWTWEGFEIYEFTYCRWKIAQNAKWYLRDSWNSPKTDPTAQLSLLVIYRVFFQNHLSCSLAGQVRFRIKISNPQILSLDDIQAVMGPQLQQVDPSWKLAAYSPEEMANPRLFIPKVVVSSWELQWLYGAVELKHW